MTLLILSFVAGILTVLAPCVLPVLPLIVGGSLIGNDKTKPDKQWLRPLLIVGSLAISVVVFTLLLKATTALLGIPAFVWQVFAGTIIILLGLQVIFPQLWEVATSRFNLLGKSYVTLGKAERHEGNSGAILTGAALGPVFTSCSPTYAFIVAVALPASFAVGFSYLLAYAIGMAMMLLLIAYLGQTFVKKLGWLANPYSNLRKVIGVLFVIVGISIMFGLDKQVQAYVIEQGWYAPVSDLEQNLRN